MGTRGAVGSSRNRLLCLSLALVVSSGAAACDQGATERAAALAGSRVVHFESTDGVALAGRIFGSGKVGVVLSHMLPADQSSWYEFAGTLAEQGYLVLTYDFRGYCPGGDAGCSKGTKDVAAIWQDTLGAITFIRAQGASRVMLVGASMGGTSSLVAAAQDGSEVSAVVTLSAPQSIEGLVADASLLTRITAAKLFLAGDSDPSGAAASAQTMYDQSPPPKRVQLLTTSDHGTELLNGNQAEIVRTYILNELELYAGS